MNNFRIRWQKTGNNQWTANPQVRNGTSYSAVIDRVGNTYTLTINPGAVVTAYGNLRSGKNRFRKFLFDK